MGNFEKLGILVILILVVVILVLAIWGVGVPPEELFPGDRATDLSSETPNGHAAAGKAAEEIVLPPEQPAPPEVDPNAGIWPEPPAEDETPPAEEVPPAPPASGPPAFLSHTVKAGETIIGIARALWGSDRGWRRILEANPGVDPESLKIGSVLRIPNPEVEAAPSRKEAPPEGVYVVKKGDNLWKIARSLRVPLRKLHDANRDVIGADASNIRPDMRLRIPR